MRSTAVAWSAVVAAFMLVASSIVSAENQQKAFEKNWVGRHVVVKRPLYSLEYNEHGRGGIKAKRDGLTVVTPWEGTYFQFDGRLKVANITEHDVHRIAPSVKLAYQKEMMLEDGVNQVIDPVMLSRFESGTELIVRTVRVGLKTIRLELSLPDSEKDLATSLTVQWPAALSKPFTERVDVEGLIQQFVTPRD